MKLKKKNCGEFNKRLSNSRPETRHKQDIGSRLQPSVHSATDRCKCNSKTREISAHSDVFKGKTDKLFEWMSGSNLHWRANSTCWFRFVGRGERLIGSFKLQRFSPCASVLDVCEYQSMTNWPSVDQSVCPGTPGLRPIPAARRCKERPSVVIDALIDKSDN